MSRHLSGIRSSFLVAVAAVSLGSCDTGSSTATDQSYDVVLGVSASMPAGFQLSAVPLIPDSAHAAIFRASDGTVLASAGGPISLSGDVPPLTMPFTLQQPSEPVRIVVEVLANGTPLLRADEGRTVIANQDNEIASLLLEYVGPGASIQFLVLEPTDSVLTFGETIQLRAIGLDAQEAVVNAGLYLVWSTDDPDVQVGFDWALEAPENRRTLTLTGRHVGTGATGTTQITFQPPASALSATNASSTASFQSAQPLVVRAVASDGLGVRGVPVNFSRLSGPGSVFPTVVYTDAGGFARSSVTVGSTTGVAVYEATAPGLQPVQFTIDVVNPPRLGLTPSTVAFSAAEGLNPTPNTKSFTLTNTGGGTMPWTVAPSKPWIAVSKTTGTLAPGQSTTVDVTVTTQALSAGTHSGSVLVTGFGAQNSPRKVAVVATITPKPVVTLSIGSLSFNVPQGSTQPVTKTFTMTNSGQTSLGWTATNNSGWLTLSSPGGQLGPGQSTSLSVTVLGAGLPPGTHTDTITLTDSGTGVVLGTLVVTLVINQTPTGPLISLTPPTLGFTAFIGSGAAPKSVSVSNVGISVLDWSASHSSSWLQLSAYAGSANAGDSNAVDVSINGTGLGVGTYTDTIRVSDPNAANSPQLTVVTLTVRPVQSGAAPVLSNQVVKLIQKDDLVNCSHQSPAGSFYQFTIDYTDADGDVNGLALLEDRFAFRNGATGANYLTPGSQFNITGNGSAGQVTFGRCTVFGPSHIVTNDLTLIDAAGNRSNTVRTVRERPVGANSTIGGSATVHPGQASESDPIGSGTRQRTRGR